jgi:dolichyl-diphosphooligosaccharide--protein glycosyltransferase
MIKGHIGDRVVRGRQFEDYMLAPKGTYICPHLGSIWVGSILHRIFSFFKKDLSIILTMSITPLILVSIICFLSFFISYKFYGIFSGIFSSLSIALSPIFLLRSTFGWFDTDTYNILFPLLILWLSINLKDDKSLKKGIISVFFLSFVFGLYSFFWVGWWYIFDLILMAILLDAFISFLIQRREENFI